MEGNNFKKNFKFTPIISESTSILEEAEKKIRITYKGSCKMFNKWTSFLAKLNNKFP